MTFLTSLNVAFHASFVLHWHSLSTAIHDECFCDDGCLDRPLGVKKSDWKFSQKKMIDVVTILQLNSASTKRQDPTYQHLLAMYSTKSIHKNINPNFPQSYTSIGDPYSGSNDTLPQRWKEKQFVTQRFPKVSQL
jgi:hypothetical protein